MVLVCLCKEGGRGFKMRYEDLKVSLTHFQSLDEKFVLIPRDYLLSLIGEILRLRRRDGARAQQGKIDSIRNSYLKTKL